MILKIIDIFNQANNHAQDSIDDFTLVEYFNQGIIDLNMYGSLKLPLLEHENITNDYAYDVCKDTFANNHLARVQITYLSFMIKKIDGFSDGENPFYREYNMLKNAFLSTYKHLVKDEYKLSNEEGGVKIAHIKRLNLSNRGN